MQTYCGPFTHGRDNQLAYDFWMPIGEELVAARAGVVREVIDRYEDQNLNWREFNLIHIEHADGSTAFYAHLMQDSAVVEVGDQVMAGELIARSGETGTSVPHLPSIEPGPGARTTISRSISAMHKAPSTPGVVSKST
jgi:murein DD-endopeptidase MepM/ murein hydrolase activator NlpD